MNSVRSVPVTAILATCLFLTGIAAAAVAPYRALVAIDGLGMTNGNYALVLTFASLGGAAASVILGHLSDKIADRRVLVLGCAFLGAVAFALVWLIPTQSAYIVAICAILPFGGALFSQSFAYSRAYYDQYLAGRSEFMMSALRSAFSLAWVVAPPLVGWIAASRSMFEVFLVAAVAQVICMALFALLFRDPDARIAPKAPQHAADGDRSPALPGYRVVGITGVALLRIALIVNLTAFPLVLTKDIVGSLTDVGIAASVAAALEVPFMFLWGWAAGKWSKEPILVINGIMFAAYLALLGFARSFQDVLILQGLNALSTAALLSITISYTQDAIRGRLGLSTSLIDVLAVIAGFASAGLFALFATPQSYTGVILAGSVISVAGAIILGISWRRRLRTA